MYEYGEKGEGGYGDNSGADGLYLGEGIKNRGGYQPREKLFLR